MLEGDILITEAIDTTKNFLYLLDKIEKEWGTVYEEIGRYDQEISDLLHEIELIDYSSDEGLFLVNEIKKIRKKRRELKDYQEVIRHLKEYLDRNKSVKINLFKKLTLMERTKKYQDTRIYNPRVRTDLKLNEIYNDFFCENEDDNNDDKLLDSSPDYYEPDEEYPIVEDDVEEPENDLVM